MNIVQDYARGSQTPGAIRITREQARRFILSKQDHYELDPGSNAGFIVPDSSR